MKMTFGVCCDYAYIEPQTKKLSMIGVIRYVFARAVPVMLKRVCVAIELQGSLAEAKKKPFVTLEIVDQDGEKVVPMEMMVPVTLLPLGADQPNTGLAYIVLEIDRLQLVSFGTYTVHVFDQNRSDLGSVKFTLALPPAPHIPVLSAGRPVPRRR